MDSHAIAADAASQHLLVRASLSGAWHLMEPYAIRRTDGRNTLYAWCISCQTMHRLDASEVQAEELTRTPFEPRFKIEV